ncbi:MAG: hypothetical protein V1837_02395 [Candidatus Woesearchaeota archaeon]
MKSAFEYIHNIMIFYCAQNNLVYDANGNLVTGDGKYREYNSLNQLTRVRQGNSTSGKLAIGLNNITSFFR